MEAFSLKPPQWTENAVHAVGFDCPKCHEKPHKAEKVWINRRSPVMTEDYRRKWQEFYLCECQKAWWAWSSDRPSSEFTALIE